MDSLFSQDLPWSRSDWPAAAPRSGKETPLQLDLDKIAEWQAKGAQVSERVGSLIREYKRTDAAAPAAEAAAAEAPAEEAAKDS